MSLDNTRRADIKPGLRVYIVLKKDQKTGELNAGIVSKILTPGDYHPRGIKVMLTDGRVGRVQRIEGQGGVPPGLEGLWSN